VTRGAAILPSVLDQALLERRRRQNLSAPRQDARGVAPSIRNFAQAIDRQRQSLERVPLLQASRADLAEAALALDEAEVAALAISIDDPQAELRRFAEAARPLSVPVLRVDLLLEEFQVYESRAAGADALLLHPRALTAEMLARMAQAASSTHMVPCIVCENGDDLLRAASLRAPVIALASFELKAPPRTLVLALAPPPRGGADAVLDESIQDAAAFRAALAAGES
jgi:indole-3-glycerol phosphate synthase